MSGDDRRSNANPESQSAFAMTRREAMLQLLRTGGVAAGVAGSAHGEEAKL
jgi:hypothetical protein